MKKHYKTDINKIRKQLEADANRRNSGFWTAAVGPNNIRVMPTWDEEGFFYRETWIHFSVGPEKKVLTCLRPYGKKCFLCEKYYEFRASDDPNDQKSAKDIKGSRRVMMNIVDLDDIERGVQVFSAPIRGVWENILTWIQDDDPKTGWGDITDVEKGYDLHIERKGTGLGTSYVTTIDKESSPFEETNLLDDLKDLNEVQSVLSYEEQKQIFFGDEYEEEEVVDDKEKIPVESLDEEVEVVEEQCDKFGKFNSYPEKCPGCPMGQDCMLATIDSMEGKKKDEATKHGDELAESLKKKGKK